MSDDHADEPAKVNNASGQIEDVIKMLIRCAVVVQVLNGCAVVVQGLNGFVRGVEVLTSFNVGVDSLQRCRPQFELEEANNNRDRHREDRVAVVLVERDE